MAKLIVHSTEHLSYENSIISIAVLGGIRLDGLDRMRVTLKVSLTMPLSPSGRAGEGPPPVRHNLDLYNDTQLEKFIRKLAERLEIGSNTLAGTIAELTQELENYRLAQIQEEQQSSQNIALSEAEKAEAIENLQNPNLLKQTIQDLQSSGIQGESDNALILLLAMTSRKSPDPISVICLAKSGTGKSYLMERVALCMPEEDKKEHTQFTGNSFYYYRRAEIRHKIFLIEDLEGAAAVLFPIRELQSKKRISKTITQKGRDGKLQTITLLVEGPVCVIACTTKESIYEDNANRSILIYLNDSKAQDNQILDYQKRYRAGLVDTKEEQKIQTKLQHMQQVLTPVKVINPYAPLIDLPASYPKQRRALPILLNFIESITFYHQYQRSWIDETTGEILDADQISPLGGKGVVLTHPSDIENGFKYLRDVLFRRSDELDGAVRDFYEKLKIILEENELESFKVQDIRPYIRLTPRSIQQYLKTLLEYGYLQITGGKQRLGYQYSMLNATSENELQQSISAHIKTVMEKVVSYEFGVASSGCIKRAETEKTKA